MMDIFDIGPKDHHLCFSDPHSYMGALLTLRLLLLLALLPSYLYQQCPCLGVQCIVHSLSLLHNEITVICIQITPSEVSFFRFLVGHANYFKYFFFTGYGDWLSRDACVCVCVRVFVCAYVCVCACVCVRVRDHN